MSHVTSPLELSIKKVHLLEWVFSSYISRQHEEGWARVALVACILLLPPILHVLGREVGHRKNIHKNKEKRLQLKGSSSSAETVLPTETAWCNSTKNESLVEDDKRIVPTGPNPLHNR
uniref:Uncharacterized protein n=1 Tax=Ananas comosus var. bracteatus TaxID=296719 RepID=A0A6V7P5D9_ANACO|nr:unnamed protein product [Ananas comosus var. bracteatus]